jgi:hypothetical protein
MSAGYKWKPLARAYALPPDEPLIQAAMRKMQCDRATALASIHDEDHDEIWKNDLYQVVARRAPEFVHLNIRRVDGFPGRDWRHFQQIKNELVGPECEAVELYPAESRLVDTSNKFHLWVMTDPTYRFPFGWTRRDVEYSDHEGVRGMRQRPALQIRK